MRVAIGCDEAAFDMKETLKAFIIKEGHEVVDCGTYNTDPVLYPDIAAKVCEHITKGDCQRGVLVCGTGIGMAMTANKMPGIRAAVCHDPFSTERSVLSNDAHVCCMGARVIAPQLATYLLGIWLKLKFAGGPSAEKIERITHYENRFI